VKIYIAAVEAAQEKGKTGVKLRKLTPPLEC
jgi:hypothetical protein